LDQILLQALRKEPERRYSSVDQFQEDLRRHLDGLPVAAQRSTFWYRTVKLTRRHAALFAAIAMLILVLMAGVAASVWQARRAVRAQHDALLDRDRAVRAEARAREELDRATRAEGNAARERDRAIGAEQTATSQRNRAVAAELKAVEERNRAVSAESEAVGERNRTLAEKRRADEEAATSKSLNDLLQSDVLSQALLAYVPARVTAAPVAPVAGSLRFESNMDDVQLLLDGKSRGTLTKGKPFLVEQLAPGQHTVEGIHSGYEPDGPRQVTVYSSRENPVGIKIQAPRRRDKDAADLLDNGVALLSQDHDYRRAATLLESAWHLDPTCSQTAYYLALTYSALSDAAKAAEYFEKAVQVGPDNLEARAAFADVLLNSRKVEEALIQISTALNQEPQNFEVLTRQAAALRLKAQYPQAIDAARKAIQLGPPMLSEPHLWLADSLRLSKKPTEAEGEYFKYLRISNQNGTADDTRQRSVAYFGLCDAERVLQHYVLAIPFCQQSLGLHPQDAFSHYVLGLAYMRLAQSTGDLGQLRIALSHFQQVLTIDPGMREADYARQNISNIQRFLGDGR
jgi:tetratricopeptide (TPR) repeat protein